MAGDNFTAAGHEISSTQPNLQHQDDADSELVAYYDEQRKRSRSDEWIGCLDATIRQLRQS